MQSGVGWQPGAVWNRQPSPAGAKNPQPSPVLSLKLQAQPSPVLSLNLPAQPSGAGAFGAGEPHAFGVWLSGLHFSEHSSFIHVIVNLSRNNFILPANSL